MSVPQTAAVIAALLLAIVAVFQLLLAAGLPLGRAAWGGEHRVLPPKLRAGSAAAALVLAAAGWVVLARADLAGPGTQSTAIRLATWVFTGFFALNTLGNLASRSRIERAVMTPATLLLVACFIVVAMS
jgi:hypothetical protein